MRILKYAVLVVVVVLSYHYWRKHHPSDEDAGIVAPADVSKNGFVELAPGNNAPLGVVLIFAPPDCQREEARRADELQELLTNAGIPSKRTETLGFSFQGAVDAELFDTVMTGRMPVVFVNGRAKNDPRVAEVVAEYYERGEAPAVDQ
ncbi:MAG: hypothetical protein ABSH26_11990 [Opitutaceae bacterium]|jgi:hypothetical protein